MTIKKSITIVGFGDSITEAKISVPEEKCWLYLLNEKLRGEFSSIDFKVINSGVGGNSDREKMARFEKDVLAYHPDYLLLEFGGNNSDIINTERLVSEYEARRLLNEVKDNIEARTQIIVITFPQIIDHLHVYGRNEKYAAEFRKYGGIDNSMNRFRQISRDFARENQLPLVDFYLEMKKAPDCERFTLPDGVHLTESGNELLAYLVFNCLKKLIAGKKD